MAQIDTLPEIVLVHKNDGVPVAATLTNGHHILYKLTEMTRAQIEEFYGVIKTPQAVGKIVRPGDHAEDGDKGPSFGGIGALL